LTYEQQLLLFFVKKQEIGGPNYKFYDIIKG